MPNNKIIAVIIVVVIVAAGVGAYALMNKDSGSRSGNGDVDAPRLAVYGNADLNDYLDSSDVTCIQNMIDGSKPVNKYADANNDGKVDSADIEVVNRLINGESTTLYYDDIKTGVTSVNYPVKSIMGIHQYVLMPLVAIGALSCMHGYVLSEAGVQGATMLRELYETQTNVDTSYNMVDFEKFSNLKEKPEYVVTYNTSLSNEAKIIYSGTHVIHLGFSKISTQSSAVLTMGFMLGLFKNAKEYVDYTDNLLKDVKDKLAASGVQSKTVMCAYMTNCIDNNDGIHTTAAVAAGGKSITDWTGSYREYAKGSEWLFEYNPDIMFYCNSWGYTEHIDVKEKYTAWADYYTDLQVYKSGNFYVVNSVMPVAMIVAYMAQAMYPDVFGAHYGDDFNNSYVMKFYNGFYQETNYNAYDYDYLITPAMVGKA